MKKVRITLIKGIVRRLPVHRANVAALGLRKIGQTVEHNLTPSIQGTEGFPLLRRHRHRVTRPSALVATDAPWL